MDSGEVRRSDRKSVQLSANYRTTSGLHDSGEILDITSEGCRVVSKCIAFRVGSRIAIRPDGLETLTGVVRWIDGFNAGIEFDSEIYEPIVEHLAQRHPASIEVLG